MLCFIRIKAFKVLTLKYQTFFRAATSNFTKLKNHRNMPCPGIKCLWDFNIDPKALVEKADELIGRCRAIYDQVGSLKENEVNYNSVIKVLAEAECEYATERNPLYIPQHLSTDKSLRDASTEADRKLQAFDVEISMHQGVFERLLILQKKNETMDPEAKRYLERLIKLGKRNGLHLPKDTQEEIKALKSHMIELGIQFNKNLNEVTTTLEFSDEELDGLSEDFIDALEKAESGKRKVTLKYPHYFPIMRKAKNPETRQKLENAFNSQCIEENTALLEELVTLRQKRADLLGFPTHAAYITDLRMAKTAETVYNFLTQLAAKLAPLWKDEKKLILELKKKECEEMKIPFDGKLNFWDLRYYTNMVEELKFAVDQNKLREYFPLPTVTKGLLEIYQELLDLEFAEIENAERWHPDVQLFSVHDSKTKELMGYFFLDLFPREGKYYHAAKFELQPGCLLPDGTRQVGVAAMVANFPKRTKDMPSLLDHNSVVTYFHEFGHVMHHICAQAKIVHFSGTEVEHDFLEAPSQMLENWCWEPEPLCRMSAHYKDESPLPQEMLDALVHSRQANSGYFNLRQISLGLFDYTIHTRDKADTKRIFSEIHDSLLGVLPSEGTNFAAHFGHLAGGYDAQYYGYLWSEVYSMDMFYTRFKTEGVMNPSVGKEYRNKILKPGGTKDAADMLMDFLGREPNDEAFLKSKGLKV